MKTVTLYYREGSSDKIYSAAIEPQNGLFRVNFAFGRRGSTLNTGTKTTVPVDETTATRIFEKLLAAKKAKGYTEAPNGAPFAHSEKAGQVTGIACQLLNPIEESDLDRYIDHPNWGMQQKFDGTRLLIKKDGQTVTGINRKGLVMSIPDPIASNASRIAGDCIIDGECVGEFFHAFDLLSSDGKDLRSSAYRLRLMALVTLLTSIKLDSLLLVHTCTQTLQKREYLALVQKHQGEGVVFKDLDAPYTPGRPASGGPQVKYKFYSTLSAVVAELNAQRSVKLRLLSKEGWIAVGNVTIPPNHSIPKVGDIVEVRYLYAYPDGALYQPTYLGRRDDLQPHDCLAAQRKFKSADQEEL